MGLFEAFDDELKKIANMPALPAALAKKPGMLAKAKEIVKKHPGKSGIALGWFMRGMLSGSDKE
jgi:hypothetical protein